MLERGWQEQCAELARRDAGASEPAYNLVVPRSACPACGHRIGALENIPVVSWLALRGKCAACKAPISARYPLVELLGGVARALAACWHFGLTRHGRRGMRAAVGAARADVHRLRHAAPARRPHAAAAVGGPASPTCFGATPFVPLRDAVIGAIAGLPRAVERLLAVQAHPRQGRHGLRRLQAAGRARRVAGWQMLPLIVLLSSVVGRGDRHHR